MPTMGDTSENASANADRSVKSRTGVWDRSDTAVCSGAISVMSVCFLCVVRYGILGVARCGPRDPVRRVGQDRLRTWPRDQAEPRDVLRHLADGGDPESWEGSHPVNQQLKGAGTGRPAGEERVTGEHECGANRVHGLQLEGPHLQCLGRALDHAGSDQVGQESVLLPVVKTPPGGDLD